MRTDAELFNTPDASSGRRTAPRSRGVWVKWVLISISVLGEFTLADWLEMMQSSRKMGPLSQMVEMLPGELGRAARDLDPREVEQSVRRTEAIIRSMTPAERRNPDILNASRRRRIAAGSGTQVQDINRLIKQFREVQRLMKTVRKTGGRNLARLFG